MRMKNIFRHIHLWLSVPVGIIILLVCLSGAMLVFEKEITGIINSDLRSVICNSRQPLPLDSLLDKVRISLPDSVKITGVTVSPDPDTAYKISLSRPKRASVWIDQYNGEIKGMETRPAFFSTMISIHRNLLDKSRIHWGKTAVGISTLLFVLILISGILIWWPHTVRQLRNSLKIHTGKGIHSLLFSIHEAGGMYIVAFLLIMALTGLTWSFKWYNNGFYSLIGAERNVGKETDKKEIGEDVPECYDSWRKAYIAVADRNPYKEITVRSGMVEVPLETIGNIFASERYMFDKQSGKITKADMYRDADRAVKARGWIFSLHTGSWGGILTRILAFISAIIGASLPITGYWLWLRRISRRH